ncbi:MAG: hypothetical protein ACI841_001227 [Planctomycetota bacterium]|jgi:hypothetical protein
MDGLRQGVDLYSTQSPGARRSWEGLAKTTHSFAQRLDESRRVTTAALLWDDAVTEYDARFLSDYLRELPIELSDDFGRIVHSWSSDEKRHHEVILSVGQLSFGFQPSELAARRPDFEPVAHLFDDEFSILCLCAYDELATVRGYTANLPIYDGLGPDFAVFMRRVIADEAWHYAAFLRAAITGFPDRLLDVPKVIARIRGSEGLTYRSTFVLDHDSPVYGEAIFDEAARVLTAQFARAQSRTAAT